MLTSKQNHQKRTSKSQNRHTLKHFKNCSKLLMCQKKLLQNMNETLACFENFPTGEGAWNKLGAKGTFWHSTICKQRQTLQHVIKPRKVNLVATAGQCALSTPLKHYYHNPLPQSTSQSLPSFKRDHKWTRWIQSFFRVWKFCYRQLLSTCLHCCWLSR